VDWGGAGIRVEDARRRVGDPGAPVPLNGTMPTPTRSSINEFTVLILTLCGETFVALTLVRLKVPVPFKLDFFILLVGPSKKSKRSKPQCFYHFLLNDLQVGREGRAFGRMTPIRASLAQTYKNSIKSKGIKTQLRGLE